MRETMMKYQNNIQRQVMVGLSIVFRVVCWGLELTAKQCHTGTQLSLAIRSLQLFYNQQSGMTAARAKVDVETRRFGEATGRIIF